MFQVACLDVEFLVGVNLVADYLHVGCLSHASHEEQTGDDQSHLNGDGQVEDDGEEEGDEQYGDVTLGILGQGEERAPAAHAIAHHHQHTGQTGHGNILCQGHEEEEDEQQYGSMDDTGDGGASAIVDVGHGAGDGTCGRNTSEEG